MHLTPNTTIYRMSALKIFQKPSLSIESPLQVKSLADHFVAVRCPKGFQCPIVVLDSL